MTNPKTPLTETSVTAAFARGPHSFVDVPGGRLACWRFGQGPDVVLVHGWPLHGATFRRIVPLLAGRFTLHVVDLPGTGSTEWRPGAPIGVAPHATTLRAFVDRLGLSSYALLAHDSGGAIARLVAAGDRRVRGVVLGNTEIPGHHPWLLQVFVAAARLPGGMRLLTQGMRVGAIRRSGMGFGGCFADPAYVDGEFFDLFVKPLFEPRVARGQAALLLGTDFAAIDRFAEVHAKIAAPVLCVWGTRDPFFPLAKARAMLPQFPRGAELVEVPGAKLFAHEDRPEEVAAAAVPFLLGCFDEDRPRAGTSASPASPIPAAPAAEGPLRVASPG